MIAVNNSSCTYTEYLQNMKYLTHPNTLAILSRAFAFLSILAVWVKGSTVQQLCGVALTLYVDDS